MKKRDRMLAALLLCAAGIGIAGLQCGLTPRRYTVMSDKLAAGTQLRLVMLSDLHSYVWGEGQRTLVGQIIAAQPDLILLCGDIVDDRAPIDGAIELLEQLPAIAPCYYVSGNHECWTKDPEALFDRIASYGIRVLRDEWVSVTVNDVRCTLCGVDDPAITGDHTPGAYGTRAQYLRVLDQFDQLPPDDLHILLAHRPEYIEEYAAHPFDLALCGHAHGGQWRIPYLMNGLIAPNQGFFPPYAGGLYRSGTLTEIVGRGLVRDWKPRLFNPPELVIVDVQS
ncbi:MAG: metallophosphoesterase [Eubacteriales bacterium]|nr:metallophosphoesterase [Eubacteriales bacterium]